jgi:hypothetical protein
MTVLLLQQRIDVAIIDEKWEFVKRKLSKFPIFFQKDAVK